MLEDSLTGPYSSFFVLFASLFGVVAIERVFVGARAQVLSLQRWGLGLGLWACAVLVFSLLHPVFTALESLFPVWPVIGELPLFARVVMLFLAADFLHYWLHRLLHWRGLWDLHAVHHQDRTYSAVTALRFHPLEVLFGALLRYSVFRMIGADDLSALLAAHLITIWNVIQHAGLIRSGRFSRLLRVFILTPGLHQTHHTADAALANRNFGLFLTIWDRLFGTFTPVVKSDMRVGVDGESYSDDMLDALLQPVRALMRR